MRADAVAKRRRRWLPDAVRAEARAMIALALPIVLTQVGQVAMMTTDAAFIGHLGPTALAGASLGLVLFFAVFMFAMGLLMATAPLAAQAFGGHRPRLLRRVIRQGLWVTILISVPGVVLLTWAEPLLVLLDQPPAAVAGGAVYMSTLKWSVPFAAGFIVLRNFVSAINRPGVALWVMLAGIPLNALLDYALIFGHFGLPRLELFGAGIATSVVNAGMFGALLLIAARRRPFRRYAILGRFWRPDWEVFRQVFRIGLPIAGIMMLEGGFFIFSFFVIGWIGTLSLAAHMVALQIPHITFMVPLGLAQAATVRVGQAVGRRDPAGAYRAGWTAVAMGLAFMAATTVVILLIPGALASVFLDPARPDSAAVHAIAVQLLLFAALFQAFDGTQAVAAGALRGLNDTGVPMGIGVVGYWVIGLSASLILAFRVDMGAQGIWLGFVFGLAAAATLLVLRLRALMRRGYIPAMPDTVHQR